MGSPQCPRRTSSFILFYKSGGHIPWPDLGDPRSSVNTFIREYCVQNVYCLLPLKDNFVVCCFISKSHTFYACNMLFKGIALFLLFSTAVKGKLKEVHSDLGRFVHLKFEGNPLDVNPPQEITLSLSYSWPQEPNGYVRTAKVAIPETQPGEKVPVVFHLHGNGGQGNTHPFGNFLGDACIIVAPDGYERSW